MTEDKLKSILETPPEVWLREAFPYLYGPKWSKKKRVEYERVLGEVLKRMREKA